MSVARIILGVLLQPALFVVLLFAPAPTFVWGRAWILIAVSLVATLVSILVLQRDNPTLLAERFEPPIQRGQPGADKVVILAFMAGFVAATSFIPKDVFFWKLLAPLNVTVASGGLVLIVLGWWIVLAAMRANAFALPVVKDQAARGQHVVDRGPYAVVRHPMYAGGALLLIGTPVWLGSLAGVIVALVPIALLAVRIGIEERFLHATLEGYPAYVERVRARLIPGLW